jgi:hypothetical protein
MSKALDYVSIAWRGALTGALLAIMVAASVFTYEEVHVGKQLTASLVSITADVHGTTGKIATTVDGVQTQVAALSARMFTSLDSLDRQVDTVGRVVTAAETVVKKVGPVLDNLASTETKLGDTIDLTSHHINDLCPDPKAVDAAIHPCGTLADFNRSLATLRGTSGVVEKSLLVFNQHEGDLFTQESTAYSHMDKSVLDFDGLVSDSDLKATIHSGAATVSNIAAITSDGRVWLHQELFPTKKKGVADAFDSAGDRVKHWMPSIF